MERARIAERNGKAAAAEVANAYAPEHLILQAESAERLVGLVRHELPDVKVILMSGYAEDVFRDEIGRDSSIEFLPKPFSLKGLAAKVKEVMAG